MHATEPVEIQKQLTYEVSMTAENEERQQSKPNEFMESTTFCRKKIV